ncbi:MAG: sigma 54-interacting transcriptional regulator [Nitrospiraceae bacterium]|nr:sigma 54-interacting transcriptional regulator [Nitrospiraceae bacterium]
MDVEPSQILESNPARYCALLKVTEAVAAHRDLISLFRDLAQHLPVVAPFDFIGLVLHDAEKQVMRVHVLETAAARHHTTRLDGLELPIDESSTGWVWTHQRPLIIPSLAQETRFSMGMTALRGIGVESVCLLPLTTAMRRLGAIGFGSLKPGAFSEADADFLKQVATQIAVAVENALNYEAAQQAQQQLARERDRLRLLLEMNNAVAAHLELRDLFQSMTVSIRRVLKADVISLTLMDPQLNQLRLYALDFPGSTGSLEEGTTCQLCGCPATAAIAEREPVVLTREDLERSESTVSRRLVTEGVRSACCVPLLLRDRTLGALNVGSLRDDAFTTADAKLLCEVAKQMALAVANSLAYQEIASLKDKLAKEKLYLEEEMQTAYNFEEIIGDSRSLKRVLKQVETVAATDSTVLILGETGSGKELIARALHNLSDRRERTFVKLNCAAIPTGLLESELFGHERGAFTGAIATKIGRFELADRGTLFLDEVGEIPLELQVKLLRVLQEQEFERLGSTRTIRVTVRVVAATNRDLAQMVEEQKFRSDLYYRLKVFPVTVPPLRERAEDIPLLVRHFAQKFAVRMKKRIDTIPAEAMKALQGYPWPGNIRELENFIERAVILSTGTDLFVPLAELKRPAHSGNGTLSTLQDAEREHILKALQECHWVIGGDTGAAAKLGMKRTTLQSKMQKLGLSRPR